MKTVIMAGGKGTRISSVASDIPKPMIPVLGKPVLEHEIECLRKQGFTDILITVSHLGNVIMDHFGDGTKRSPVTGAPFGVRIEYYYEEEPLGNAGALFRIRDKLTDDFLLLNADSIFDVDIRRFYDFHKEKGGLATILTHPNSHPYDSGLIIARSDKSVAQWLNKEESRPKYYVNRVNAGVHILSKRVLDDVPLTPKVDLDRQILKPLCERGELFAYDSPEYVSDMGTPERYQKVCEDFRNGIPSRRNLSKKQKAIFLDRDGTINRYVGFLRNIEEFELLPTVSEAVRMINESGYLAIVVTNQPVIARGEVTYGQLDEIHNKMETLLGMDGAFLNGIYYCPHHPDKGYEGEIPELKCVCACRKPEPGMLLQAAEDFNIDLSESWMVGDGENDIRAGKNAGCRTALIGKENYGQDIIGADLRQVVKEIFYGKA